MIQSQGLKQKINITKMETNSDLINTKSNTQSESIKELLTAFDKFQEECPAIKKNATNPFTKSSYADYPHIVETIRPHLRKNGFVITDINLNGNNSFDMRVGDEVVNHILITIKTTLHHLESGEWMASTLSLPLSQANAQQAGSAITYARRYNIVTLLGLTTESDDDGNGSSKKESTQAKSETKKTEVKKEEPKAVVSYDELKKVLEEQKTLKALKDCYAYTTKSESYKKLTDDQKSALNKFYTDRLLVIGGTKK